MRRRGALSSDGVSAGLCSRLWLCWASPILASFANPNEDRSIDQLLRLDAELEPQACAAKLHDAWQKVRALSFNEAQTVL